LTLKVLQNNDRVAEVQFICNSCGTLVRTSMIPMNEIVAQKNKNVICWQCKRNQTKNLT
jgi:hypothetical protein